jgi:short-subunit dehydrogenase
MKNKNALIYGATGGLGKATIKELLNKDVNVYAVARNKSKLDTLAKQFSLNPRQVYCCESITSQSDFDKVRNWIKHLNSEFHFAIHCAGQGLMKPASKLSLREWNQVIDINLTSAFAFYKLYSECHALVNFEIVYFSSASLNQTWPKNSLYSASKSGLEAFAGSLQQEIKTAGGRVWLYRAGSIHTGFFDNVKNHMPVKKMLSANEVAAMVVRNLETPAGIYSPLIPILNE